MVSVHQYDVYWVDLTPTRGSKTNKICPCVVVSPDELNAHLATAIVVPLTSQVHGLPWRMTVQIANKDAELIIDQIKALDKLRIGERICSLNDHDKSMLKSYIKEMLVD